METVAFVLALGILSLVSDVESEVPTAAVQEEQQIEPELDLRRQHIMITNHLFREIRLAGLERGDEGS